MRIWSRNESKPGAANLAGTGWRASHRLRPAHPRHTPALRLGNWVQFVKIHPNWVRISISKVETGRENTGDWSKFNVDECSPKLGNFKPIPRQKAISKGDFLICRRGIFWAFRGDRKAAAKVFRTIGRQQVDWSVHPEPTGRGVRDGSMSGERSQPGKHEHGISANRDVVTFLFSVNKPPLPNYVLEYIHLDEDESSSCQYFVRSVYLYQ